MSLKKIPARSRSVENLFNDLELREEITTKLLKKHDTFTIQKQFVKKFWPLKQLFTLNKLTFFWTIGSLFGPVFYMNVTVLFSINPKTSYRFLTLLDFAQELGINEVKRIVLIFREQSARCDVI